MSDTQIVIVLVVGASAVIIFCCVMVTVVLRMHRVVRSQLETVNKLLSAERTGRDRDPPRESS